MTWLANRAHSRWLETESDRLLKFAKGARLDDAGFGWLDDIGGVFAEAPLELWINARMVHSFALAHLLGRPGYAALVDHGMRAIDTLYRDSKNGGWFAEIRDGRPHGTKAAYPHAFVVLAAASALHIGHPMAERLLAEALDVQERYFWDEQAGMVREEWDFGFTTCDDYRGVNANMHTVEAYLAAADATGDVIWRERATRITDRVVNEFARENDWRIPEHFNAAWERDLEFNADAKADPFRPYGSTIGHSFEWARLALHVVAANPQAPASLTEGAAQLYDKGVAEGWNADGAPGFVYTVDWSGKPVVRERMHWVVCEAIGAAAALHRATGQDRYDADYTRWWQYAYDYMMDFRKGSWEHELDQRNKPSSLVWRGKSDLYHSLQATLIPRLPLAPSLAAALAQGELDS